MQISFFNRGSTLVARLKGELDHHCAEYVRNRIDAEIIKSTTRNLIIDLGGVSFMDSSGIGIVMGRYRNINRLNGRTVVVAASPQIRKLLGMSGMQKFVPVCDRMDDAIKHLA